MSPPAALRQVEESTWELPSSFRSGMRVPVRIVGADRALRPGTRLPRRARVRVVVGEPIAVVPAKATIAAARDLTARVRDAITAL